MAYRRELGVYIITNTLNGKKYVGSSSNVRKRWYRHKFMLIRGIHFNPYLQASWDKYGPEVFSFSMIEELPEADLRHRELYWINKLTPEYNIMLSVGGKFCVSEETKQKLRKANLGKTISEETKRKISLTSRGKSTTPVRVSKRESFAYNAKFSKDQVDDIRQRYSSGESQRSLAVKFKVCQTTIRDLVNRYTYTSEGSK